MSMVHELSHPLVQDHLAVLRDKTLSPLAFRNIVQRLSVLLAYEATADLELRDVEVETPLAVARGQRIQPRLGLVPILRAGLGMVDPVLDLLPESEVWHLGFYRDEKTYEPVEYYRKFPETDPVDVALVLDPMLATGGSAVAALEAVTEWGVARTKLLVLIAAPEGVKKVQETYPDTEIYVCVIDDALDENAYIVPGLGDAGDRIFNATAH